MHTAGPRLLAWLEFASVHRTACTSILLPVRLTIPSSPVKAWPALHMNLLAVMLFVQSQPLAQLLQQCAGPDAAADLQLNVVAALGQLARDQQPAAQALMDPQGEDCHSL